MGRTHKRCMGPRSPTCLSAALAVWLLLTSAAQAQVIPFQGNFGPGLSPEDNQLLFESVARLNAAEPSQVGRSEAWSNPQTKSLGPPQFSEYSTQAVWLATWYDTALLLLDGVPLAIIASPGAKHRPG